MKNLFKVLFAVAAATTLFVACNKEVEIEINPAVRTVEFSAGPVTKTIFGTLSGTSLPTLWTENKTVGISLNFATMKQSTTPEVASGGATATFQADIEDSGSAPYTFYAVSPYSSVISVSSDYKSVQVDIPASQTPLATSVDENAQILVAKYAAGSSFPTSVALDFDHLTAYGKISFSNLSLASGETIESVSLTATKNWVGRFYYYFEDYDTYSEGDMAEKSAGKTLTLVTSSATDIWFACAPVDLGGETVKVVVTTNEGTTYTKNVTIPAGKTFAAGKVNAFTINMNGITADVAQEYVLVTNPSELTVGSQVIIAAPGATASAISTTQNTNNRAEASVTKEQSNTVIVSPSDAVQIFTIEAGTTSGTIAFNTGSGYIYAASSSGNQMKTEENRSANSSWTVAIDSEGVATITAQGSNTRNVIRYNSSNNPPIYACYGSTSTTGSLVSLYKLSAPDNRSESGLGWDDTDGLGDVKDQELVLPALVNPNSLTVTYSSSDETVATVAENSHSVTLLKEGETQIHAIFAGDETYKPADVYYTLTVSDSRTAVTLSFGTASYELTVGSSDYNNFAGQAVTASPSVAVTYALSGASVGTLNTSTGAVALDGSTLGTATITASFAGNATYKAAEDATYTIVVSAASPSGTPGDETFDLTTNTYTTSGSDSVTWTGESAVINNSSASGGTSATNYLGGDANNRTSSRFYANNTLTITPNTDYTITSIVFTATSNSYATALNGSAWTNASSSVSGSTVTVTPTNGANAVSASVGGTCGFTSIVVNYIYSGVVVTKYAITVDNGIANGSVSADLSEAVEGATVTLTATPASGYALDAWNVYKTGESGTKVTVSANAFTMPAYAVTVSASFAAVPTISMNTTSIADVAAAGVSATAASAYSLLNGASNNDVTITCDGTVVTAASKNATAGSIDYTVASNSGNARNGWIKVKYGTEDPHEITVSQLAGESATPTLQYTLDGTIAGSGNAYAGDNTATQNGIGWVVNGNLTTNPWRIGGKNISNTDRVIYSTTAISANISQIIISHGAASSITVNSMTVSVHSSAADAAAGTNAIATFTPSFVANNTVTVNKADNTSWAGKFYRIVYNVSVSGNTNRFIAFNSAAFYGI